MRKYFVVAVLAIGSLLFCSAVLRKDVAIEKYINFAHRPEFGFAGKLIRGKDSCDGSCVLIGSRFVLTAAHAHGLYENCTVECKFGDRIYRVKRWLIHPRYVRKTFAGPDLAVLELEDTVANIRPVALNKDVPEIGKRGSIIGYGYISFAGFPTTALAFGKRIGGENMIDSIGGKPDSISHLASMCMADFDDREDSRCCNVMGSPRALPLEYGMSAGDSGGGMYIKVKNKWVVAGIAHGVTHMINAESYGEVSLWIRVSVKQLPDRYMQPVTVADDAGPWYSGILAF